MCIKAAGQAEALFTPYETQRFGGRNENYDYDLLQVTIGDKRAHWKETKKSNISVETNGNVQELHHSACRIILGL